MWIEASATRWWWGDPPSIDLKDGWSGLLRWTLDRRGGGSIAASVRTSSALIEGYDPPVSLGLAVRQPLRASRGSLTLSVAFGLTETAPDVLGGLGWTWRIGSD
jgi:hypothetical protein